MRKKKKSNKSKIVLIVIAVIICAILTAVGYKKAPDYFFKQAKNKTNLVINNNNVTLKMKDDVYIDDKGIIYLSKNDVKNYFDKYITYDEETGRLITTSDTKVATMYKDSKKIIINDASVEIAGSILKKDDKVYIPFSEIGQSVYNVEVNYIESTDRVVVDSLDRELKKADSAKNIKVKYKQKFFSKTIDKVKKGEKIIVIEQNDKWSKIRTEDGYVGYIKSSAIANLMYVRKNMEINTKINGKVNLVWDYYSEYAKAPDRSSETIEEINVVAPSFFYIDKGSDGTVKDNANENGKSYINWAHSKGYKVWAMVSNNSYLTTTEGILNDYDKRTKLVNNIVSLAEKYNVDGINIDFENMNEEDRDEYSSFIIELAPRLKDIGKTISVDVTAPDGSGTWSLCFDRDVLADVSDYIIFMAYDQYGIGGNKEGTTAGCDWVEKNVGKFLNQEAVSKDKLVLGIPLYTRLWKNENGEVTSKVVNMKDVYENIPDGTEKKWDDNLKQYYVEYTKKNATYKMWIEDETSIKEKISIANKYELAGIAFWEKDRETDGLWNAVSEELNK